MKITNLESTVVCVPYKEPEPWAWGIGHHGVNSIIIELSTDEGIKGIGEGTSPHASVEYSRIILESAKKLILGDDPFDIERIMRKIWGAGLVDHRVLSGVEMALWDIAGKASKKPVYKLLGGEVNKAIPFAPYINRKKPEEMAQQAIEFLKKGFGTFNIKVGIDTEDDIDAVRAVRQAIGDKHNIRVDANMAWSPSTAIKTIKKMEKYDLEFVEDPTYVTGMKRVLEAVDTPICSGAETVYAIFRVVKEGLADIIGHIDPRMQGGIWNAKKACSICEMAGIPVVAHAGWELTLATSAVLHIAASTPNFVLPNQTYYMYLTDDVCKNMLTFEDGCIKVPETPGLGIELDQDKVRKYADLYQRQGGFSIYEPSETKRSNILPFQIY